MCLPTPSNDLDATQSRFFRGFFQFWFKSFFFYSTDCHTYAKGLCWKDYSRIFTFLNHIRALWGHTASSRIWNQLTVLISNNDIHNAMGTSTKRFNKSPFKIKCMLLYFESIKQTFYLVCTGLPSLLNIIYIYIYIYILFRFFAYWYMIKISGKVDKSNTYNGFSSNI